MALMNLDGEKGYRMTTKTISIRIDCVLERRKRFDRHSASKHGAFGLIFTNSVFREDFETVGFHVPASDRIVLPSNFGNPF